MVAMVFIGIVTAAMLRNTGSQAVATAAYGTVAEMTSTVKSGMVATESYFERNNESALSKITAVMEETKGHNPFFVGSENTRHPLSGKQFIRSKIASVDPLNSFTKNEQVFVRFDIDVGKSTKGRSLKKATAHYHAKDVVVTRTGDIGNNAFYMGGDFLGPAQFTVKGNATFKGRFHSNSGDITKFIPGDDGNGSVYFEKDATFDNVNIVEFHTKTYFNADLFMKDAATNNTAFKSDFGVNGTFHTGNNSGYDVAGNVWINGNVDGSNPTLRSINSSGTLYHSANAILPSDDNIIGFQKTQLGAALISDIPSQMGITSRSEPNFNLVDTVIEKGKSFKKARDIFPNGMNAQTLNDYILNARNTFSDEDKDKYFYNEHLLIEWDGGDINTSSTLFDEKVIFNVTSDMNVNGNFYNSNRADGSKASTMIFVGQSATINGFGVPNDGHFRGLIYTPPEHTKLVTFHWGPNSSVDGAVILKGSGGMNWNGGGASTLITRNDELLMAFAGLTDANIITVITPNGLPRLVPLGYYFH